MRSRKPIVIFNLVAFIFTWTIAGLIYFLLSNGAISKLQQHTLHCLGALGPALGAFIAAYLCYGREGVIKLSKKIRVPKRFTFNNVAIVFSPFFLFVIGLLIFRILMGSWFDYQQFIETNY